MPFEKIVESVQKGIGSTLGGLVLIIGFGVMLGSLLAESGAAQQISSSLIRIFGAQHADPTAHASLELEESVG